MSLPSADCTMSIPRSTGKAPIHSAGALLAPLPLQGRVQVQVPPDPSHVLARNRLQVGPQQGSEIRQLLLQVLPLVRRAL